MNRQIYLLRENKLMKNPSNLKTLMLIIKATDKCNLACTYCYASEEKIGKLGSMDFDKLFDEIDSLLLANDYGIEIVFHGGEPLLVFDEIEIFSKKIRNQFYSWRVNFSLQSNGTLISENIINVLKEFNIGLGISVDGKNEIQNNNRVYKNNKPAFKDIQSTIQFLLDKQYKAGILCVLNQSNHDSMLDILKYYSQYTNSISFNPLIPYTGEIYDSSHYIEGFIQCIDWLLFNNEDKDEVDKYIERTIEIMAKKIDDLFDYDKNICFCSPCKMGTQVLTICTNGDIYPCDWLLGSVPSEGNIYEFGISEYIKSYQPICHDLPKECKECRWKVQCGGGCTAERLSLHGIHNWQQQTTIMCECNKAIFTYLFSLKERGKELSLLYS